MRMTWRKVFICFIPVLAPRFLARFVGWFFLLAFCFFSICVGPKQEGIMKAPSINSFNEIFQTPFFIKAINLNTKNQPQLSLSLSLTLSLSLSNQNTFNEHKKEKSWSR